LRNESTDGIEVSPPELAYLVRQVSDGVISRANGRDVLGEHVSTGRAAAAIVEARGFRLISDTESLTPIIDSVLGANATAVADYRSGKAQAVGFLVGQVMKATRGQANPAAVQAAVRERLDAPDRGAA
ncbi:MAG TPA: hypothetical protein VKA85_10785, partial [Candidatus Limnocylindrales bacterium]|nr:hypothetical protein [Candidatus Limnocylindrales bacterium]